MKLDSLRKASTATHTWATIGGAILVALVSAAVVAAENSAQYSGPSLFAPRQNRSTEPVESVTPPQREATPTAPETRPTARLLAPEPASREERLPSASSRATPTHVGPLPLESVPPPKAEPAPLPPAPMSVALDLARRGQAAATAVRDYTTVMVRRDHLGGRLSDAEHFTLKVRHAPLSIYVFCQGPVQPRGTEVLYVAGRDGNQALLHAGGLMGRVTPVARGKQSLLLPVDDPRLLPGRRRPLDQWGVAALARDIVLALEVEERLAETEVKLLPAARVEDRDCVCIQVSHPTRRANFRFHLTRAYYETRTGLPIRWEAYTWPARASEPPLLIEELTFRQLRLNVGLTDADFDPRNPTYKFRG